MAEGLVNYNKPALDTVRTTASSFPKKKKKKNDKLNSLNHITNTHLIVLTTQHYSHPVILTRLLVTPTYTDTQAWCHTGDVERSTFTDKQRRFAGDVRGFRTERRKRGHKKSSKQWCKAERQCKRKRCCRKRGQGMQRIKDAQQMGSEKKRQTDEEEQMRNIKVQRQTLLTHKDLNLTKSPSQIESLPLETLASVSDWLCLGLAIENWFQISNASGFDTTSDFYYTYRFMCVYFI